MEKKQRRKENYSMDLLKQIIINTLGRRNINKVFIRKRTGIESRF